MMMMKNTLIVNAGSGNCSMLGLDKATILLYMEDEKKQSTVLRIFHPNHYRVWSCLYCLPIHCCE